MIKMKSIVADLQKKYGKGTISTISDLSKIKIDRFNSGSLILDSILGGGWPYGRIIEIFGDESGGKTSIALMAIASVQNHGKGVCFIDMEHSLSLEWAKRLGVDIDKMYLSTPDCAEDALSIAEAVIQSEETGLVVIDSVSSLVPRAEVEGEMGDSHMGVQARLMGSALRKMTPLVAKYKTTVMFINQTREKIGVVYGNPETTSGGKALRFYASIRIRVGRGPQITEGTNTVGNVIRLHTVKNKTFPPFKKTEVDFYYETGIKADSELSKLVVETGIVFKNGAFYTIPCKADIEDMVKQETYELEDIIKLNPKREREKIKGYDNVAKSLRLNLNLQESVKTLLEKGKYI